MSPDPCNEEPPACALAQETTVLLCAEPEVGLRAPLSRVLAKLGSQPGGQFYGWKRHS